MHRRSFIRNTAIASAGIFLLPRLSKAAISAADEAAWSDSELGFKYPSAAARPWVVYMWMNGNITQEGITADLEAMKRMGIGGGICFNTALGIPRGPVGYAGEAWMAATVYAAKKAERLGLELALHNSPGYSGTGGPWIKPESSMQQLVWTETLVNGGKPIDLLLERPYAKMDYYRDAMVVAFPASAAEKTGMKDQLSSITINGKVVDKTILTNGNPADKLRVEPGADKKKGGLLLTFSKPFTAASVTITRQPEVSKDMFGGPQDYPPVLLLESSKNGIDFRPVCSIKMPALRSMDAPASQSFAPVTAKYFRIVTENPTWISGINLHSTERLNNWPAKTNYAAGDVSYDGQTVQADAIVDPETVVDISEFMDEDGKLHWTAPAGRWVILRIGHTTTGEGCAAAPDSGQGLQCDKFSKEALEVHFDAFLGKLIAQLKPYKSFKGITVDSLEAGKQNWSAGFPVEFKIRAGYDITHWMPAMTGRIVGSVSDSSAFLWDVRRTHADLLAENYYGHFKTLCQADGLQFMCEPYGDGTIDSLQAGQHADIPMGEFWTQYSNGDTTSRQAASLAHAWGKPIAAAEAFTGMPPTAKWSEYPYSLKAEGDYFFTLGINRLVLHTFVHQPYFTGFPGMTMGPFGAHFDRTNTWAEQTGGWTDYVTRAQHLLQQGLYVADICCYQGEDPASGIPDFYKILPAGFAGDVIGNEVLLQRLSVQNGFIQLPDGMRYSVFYLPSLKSISYKALQKIRALVAEGMWLLVNDPPLSSPGRGGASIGALTIDIWADPTPAGKVIGMGRVFHRIDVVNVLTQKGITPDCTWTARSPDAAIHYIHKKLPGLELYFISNHKRRAEQIVCSFRISGLQPEIWDAESGTIVSTALYESSSGRTSVPLTLTPAGSLFVVFRKKSKTASCLSVLKDGKPVLSVHPFVAVQAGWYAEVQNNFTIALWAKPDSYAPPNKSFLFHPPQGEVRYGKNHAAVGLAAGCSSVRVYERSSGDAKEVLISRQPLDGWSHIALVYQAGVPYLYINGGLSAQGLASGKTVHPGIETPAVPEQYLSYFEGNATTPQLIPKACTPAEIKAFYVQGLPPPDAGAAVTKCIKDGRKKLRLAVGQNGEYVVQLDTGKTIQLDIRHCSEMAVTGSWQLKFPIGVGAPSGLELPALQSLSKHADFDVRHFSGTMTYTKTVQLPSSAFGKGLRVILDLGRVEVMAAVRVNGRDATLLWKEPFMTDITDLVSRGDNRLEVQVTNLWPNRLIGDESLPAEHEYNSQGFIQKLPDWYTQNLPKPGRRATFSVWHHFGEADPLPDSGLLGPVSIRVVVEKSVR